MSIRDQLWGGGSLEAPSPEATSPVPPSVEEARSFLASARKSLRGLVKPLVEGDIIVSDSIDAERVWPEGVSRQESADYFDEARSVRVGKTRAPLQGILELEFPE